MTISVIDIGTSSIKTVISTVDVQHMINIVGVSNIRHAGMKKGNIVDIEATVNAIHKSIQDAEMMAGMSADNLYVSIGGENVIGFSGKGIVAKSPSSEITIEDVVRVIDQTKITATMDNDILHTLPKEFTVDDLMSVKNPVGIVGSKLTAETMLIAVPHIMIQNFSNAIDRAGHKVNEFIVQHVASYHSVLDDEEKELGVALVDIGGGTVKVSIFFDDALRYIDTIAIGGEYITQDLSIGLRTPKAEAENIKIKYGSCLKDNINPDETVNIKGVNMRDERPVTMGNIVDYIKPRTDEIIELVQQSISRSGFMNKLNTGLVITGGSANLKNIKELTERKMNLPVKIGYPQKLSGISDMTNDPIFGVAIGMTLYAYEDIKRSSGGDKKKKAGVNKEMNKVIGFFRDILK